MSVLVIDDDPELVDLLRFALSRASLEVVGVTDAADALGTFEAIRPEIVVLDLNLGPHNGLDILQRIRERDATTPVIIITARSAEADKIRGLELGADDYVTKPFSHRELVARIHSNLRSIGAYAGSYKEEVELRAGPLVIDLRTHVVTKNGLPLKLTVTEYRLLLRLMREPDRVVPTATLLRHVWGYDENLESDVVRVTVHRLRKKLGDDPSDPQLLRTRPGVGVLLHVTER